MFGVDSLPRVWRALQAGGRLPNPTVQPIPLPGGDIAPPYGLFNQLKIPTEDLILAEFSLIVSTRIRWGHGVQLVVSDVKPIYACVGNRKRILTSQLTSPTKCGMGGCIYGS